MNGAGFQPTQDGRPPSWSLPRGVIVLLAIAGAAIAVAALRTFAGIAGPVMLALILTVAVSPLGNLLAMRGMPRWAVALTGMLVVQATLIGLAVVMVISLAQLVALLPTYEDRFAELVDDLGRSLAELGIGQEQVRQTLQNVDLGSLLGVVQGWLTGLLSTLSGFTLVIATVFFMALDSTRFPDRLRAAAVQKPRVVAALAGFARSNNRYLLVSTIFGLIVALIDTLVLYWLEVPLAPLWGLLSFITNYIPNIGFVIGLVPPALLGLLDGGPRTMAAVIVSYCLVNFVIQSIIQPKVVGDVVGLSATLTFLSLIVWTWILGPLGAVLAIPMTLLVKALLVDIDPAARWLGELISADRVRPGPLEPGEPSLVPPSLEPSSSVPSSLGPSSLEPPSGLDETGAGQRPDHPDVETDDQQRPERVVRDEEEVG